MTKQKEHLDDIPDWLDSYLDKMDGPDDDMLAKYDYLKEDFLTAVRQAVKIGKKTNVPHKLELVEVVFSLTGKVIKTTQSIVRDLIPTPDKTLFAMSRGSDAENKEKTNKCTTIGRIKKDVNNVCIEISMLREYNTLKIQVNALDIKTKSEIRPFTLHVQDTDGENLINPAVVGAAQLPPKLPDPSPGIYIFSLEWENGTGTVKIEIRE